MAANTYTVELSSSIPAQRIYKAIVVNGDSLIPKAVPQAIKSCQILHGDGGVGTIKLFTLPQGIVKHRIDGIDEEKLSYTYSIIEGEEIADVIDSAAYHTETAATAEGGSISKITCTYTLKGSADVAEENIKTRKEGLTAIFRAAEAYLQANPTEYN